MRPARVPAAAPAGLAMACLVAACGILAPPSPPPSPTPTAFVPPPAPATSDVLACIGIVPAECRSVAAAVLRLLPGALGEPFSIQVRLGGCAGGVEACPPSLAARRGQALVEYPEGGEARLYEVAGPPPAPVVEPAPDAVFTGPIQPGSPLVDGSGPFEFEVGHCGLQHVVDFNAAFWVLSGEVDGEHQALNGDERGTITLLSLTTARYTGAGAATFELVRFPGAKRFQLCD